MLISLAWKNVWRNKKRSLIIVLSIAFGLWGGLIAGAVMMGWGESMVNTAIDRDLAHIQIHKKGFLRDKEITHYIPDGLQVVEGAKKIAGVKAVSGRTIIEAMASSPTSNFGVKIVGIDPEDAQNVTNIHQKIVEGNYFKEEKLNPVVIGQKLASRLGLRLHSKIILGFQGLDGSLTYAACRIVGIYKTESSYFDESNVFIRQSDLFRLLNCQPIIHEIAIRAQSARIMPQVYEAVKGQWPDLSVKIWKDLAPEVAFTASAMEGFTYFFLAIILFALLFGITNTMLMSVVERFRELGILLAVGMKRSKIFIMILMETIFLSITGGIAGIIIGILSIAYFSYTGIDLSAFASSLATFGASTMLYPFLPLEMYIVLPVMIVVTASFSAALPAWKAIHIEPAAAIRIY